MDRGLYIAASGMLAEQVREHQIANDLANASTPGYRADRTSQRGLGDLLLADGANGRPVGAPSTAVQVDAVQTDWTPQPAALVAGTPVATGQAGQVRARALEGSGADPARSMVDMISSLRACEAGQRVITTLDETLGKAAGQVGTRS